jgi:nicotinamide-nucleotide adenylyltransferase
LTPENPFTAEERESMIKKSLNIKIPYSFKRIPDFDDDEKWVKWIASKIGFDVVMTNSENERKIFSKAGFNVVEIPFFDRDTYSATEVRRRILAGEDFMHLLPKGTLEVIEEIDGINRIKKTK